MTYTRLLTIDDAEQVLSVIQTQNITKFNTPINIDTFRVTYTNPSIYDKSLFVELFGLFEDDGVLDCFWVIDYPTKLSTRANDPVKKEKATVLSIVFSRKKPDRLKNDYGLDVNQIALQKGMVEYFEQTKYFTRWFVTPQKFKTYLEDPDYVKTHRHKYSYVMTPLPTGTISADPFVATYVTKRVFPIDMKVYQVSMNDQFR